MNTSDFLMQRLIEWGVTRVYGYPGDGINGVMGAFGRIKDKIDFIQVRHEEMAAFMACGHAKFTGQVGVCLATSGPGAIHLLNGLYDAKMDHVPVVAIVGQAATTALGGSYQQEVDLQQLFEDVADYVYTVSSPMAVRHIVDRAFRTAIGYSGVAAIVLPKNIQEERYEKPARMHNTLHSSAGYCAPVVLPRATDLQAAAAILNAGERVAMLVGAGALGARDEIMAVAERLNAGVAKALLGKAAVSDELPYVTGTIGLLGTAPSFELMENCDTLLMVGTSFPYSEFLPKEGQARGIQIDIDPKNLGLRYPTELNLVGDAAATLFELLPLLAQKTDRSWPDRIAKAKQKWTEQELARAKVSADPINPQLLFVSLSERIPHDAIVTGDAGTATNWYARNVMMRGTMKGSLSGGLATMGSAVPYAIAAKFAFPDRVAVACTGDGAMQMNGNAELLTVAKYWKRWSDPRIVFLVLDNDDLNQVTWEMRIMEGDPKFSPSQDLPPFNYAKYAEQLGFLGIRVERPEDVDAAWDRAFAADRPVVIDAKVSANIAQLPPHITFEEAHKYFSALVKGDPDEASVIKETIKSIIAGVVPSRERS
ncbi:MAG TPA: thiamine pyrophosphate-requiring protein [Verrucomicrobiae bacterium]|nr:thiamine pyrophosphate-requiring protein [Verrucomicrobiae bacterium]